MLSFNKRLKRLGFYIVFTKVQSTKGGFYWRPCYQDKNYWYSPNFCPQKLRSFINENQLILKDFALKINSPYIDAFLLNK
jgi:hypothetical protein